MPENKAAQSQCQRIYGERKDGSTQELSWARAKASGRVEIENGRVGITVSVLKGGEREGAP